MPALSRFSRHGCVRRKGRSVFVRILVVVFKRVFMGQKISGLLFKISGSDFEIRATNFFIAPGRGKRAENQFSFFGRGKRRFRAPVLHSGVAFFLEDFLPRVVPFRQKVLPLQPISTRVDRFVLLATTKKQC